MKEIIESLFKVHEPAHYWTDGAELCSCGHGKKKAANSPHLFRHLMLGHIYRIPACCTLRFMWDCIQNKPSGQLRGSLINKGGKYVPCGIWHKSSSAFTKEAGYGKVQP